MALAKANSHQPTLYQSCQVAKLLVATRAEPARLATLAEHTCKCCCGDSLALSVGSVQACSINASCWPYTGCTRRHKKANQAQFRWRLADKSGSQLPASLPAGSWRSSKPIGLYRKLLLPTSRKQNQVSFLSACRLKTCSWPKRKRHSQQRLT